MTFKVTNFGTNGKQLPISEWGISYLIQFAGCQEYW